MLDSKKKPPTPQVNTLTLLATTALAVSNLMVGIMTGNRFLIAASAVLAAAFAAVYIFRNKLFRPKSRQTAPPELSRSDKRQRLPLWVFPALLFVAFPGILLFLRFLEQGPASSV